MDGGIDNLRSKNPREPTLDEALQTIDVIEQHIRQAGRVDAEPDMLNAIRADITNGKSSPREGIVRANQILEKRQDYN